jgi:hypothetical protein
VSAYCHKLQHSGHQSESWCFLLVESIRKLAAQRTVGNVVFHPSSCRPAETCRWNHSRDSHRVNSAPVPILCRAALHTVTRDAHLPTSTTQHVGTAGLPPVTFVLAGTGGFGGDGGEDGYRWPGGTECARQRTQLVQIPQGGIPLAMKRHLTVAGPPR